MKEESKCAAVMPCGAVVTNVYDAYEAGKKSALAKQEQCEHLKKLKVTLEDRTIDIELIRYKKMFETACFVLGAVSHALGCDPEERGAEKLLSAIAELKTSKQEQGEPVAWEGFTNFANPLGTRLIFTTKFEADEWLKDFVEGHAWLKPLSYTTPQPKQEQSVSVSAKHVGEPVALPDSMSKEANAAIEAMLQNYNWPCNTQNAGRAGWQAARKYLSDTTPYVATQQQQRPFIKPLTGEQKQLKFMKWGLVPANQSWGIQDRFYAGIAYAEAAHGITSATDFKE